MYTRRAAPQVDSYTPPPMHGRCISQEADRNGVGREFMRDEFPCKGRGATGLCKGGSPAGTQADGTSMSPKVSVDSHAG